MHGHECETTAHPAAEEDHTMRTMAYEQLLSRLSGGDRDFWDRPDGSWGGHEREEPLGDAETERRADANSAYVIGSKALRRDELDNARAWFAVAADAEHPGAAFRSALTAARSAAQRDIRASYNLVYAAREAEVRRWLRVAADWGHGDARHLIGTLSESGENAGCVRGPGAGGDGGDGEAPASVRPVRVEDTEFYDELRAFLLFPGHGERPEVGQEPEAEAALPGEVSGRGNAGECSVVPMEPAGAVPDRSGATLLRACRIRRVLDERRLLFVLVAARGEVASAASGWSAWHEVVRRREAGWSGLRAELPPAVVTSAATSLRMAEVELPGGDAVGAFRLLLDRVMRLPTADGAHTVRQRYAGMPQVDRLPDSVLRADGELQRAVAHARLVWLVLNGDRLEVEAAGAMHLPGTATVPSSLGSFLQDSASLDDLGRSGDTDLWGECARWLSSAGSGAASRHQHAAQAEAGRGELRLWCSSSRAREPAWWVVLAHVGWPELDTAMDAERDAGHGGAPVSDCPCVRCARARPDGRLPQAQSRPNSP